MSKTKDEPTLFPLPAFATVTRYEVWRQEISGRWISHAVFYSLAEAQERCHRLSRGDSVECAIVKAERTRIE